MMSGRVGAGLSRVANGSPHRDSQRALAFRPRSSQMAASPRTLRVRLRRRGHDELAGVTRAAADRPASGTERSRHREEKPQGPRQPLAKRNQRPHTEYIDIIQKK
jgi:hypothetical protein